MTEAGVLRYWRRLLGWRKRPRRGALTPVNLVRLCRRRTEFVTIINEARATGPPWDSELIDRVVEFVLDGGNTELSMYETATTDPLDHGHALGVIAEGITQSSFRATARRRSRGSTRGTLLIPTACLPTSVSFRLTPEHNLDFYPANNRHFDVASRDDREMAEAILEGIHNQTIAWTFLGNEDGSYRLQAAIAYSHCLSVFGRLDQFNPPAEWMHGQTLTASEQIEILKHLVNIAVVDSPLSTS